MKIGALRKLVLFLALIAAPPSFATTAVAVYGFEYPQNRGAAVNTLNANGYLANSVGLIDIAIGLPGYDVLYVTHPYDGGGWSPAACAGLKTFLAAGKGVVLEWDASLLVFTSLAPDIYVNATPQCSFFAGVADRGQSVGFNTPINVTEETSPLMESIDSPFAMGAASDYMYQITGFDPALWKVPATYAGWGVPNNASVMYTRYQGTGCVALGTMAFADNGYSEQLDTSSRQLLLNMMAAVTPGSGSCLGILPPQPSVPALSPVALGLLLVMMLGSAFVIPKRLFRRKA